MAEQKRSGEYVLKNCSYTGIAINPDAKNIYAVGSDRKLKEISDSQVRLLYFYLWEIKMKEKIQF